MYTPRPTTIPDSSPRMSPPRFQKTTDSPYLFTSQSDVAALRWGYKKSREILRRMGAFRGALVPAHPQFAVNSAAVLKETAPVPLNAPNIVYSAADDAAIDTYIRSFGTHSTLCLKMEF